MKKHLKTITCLLTMGEKSLKIFQGTFLTGSLELQYALVDTWCPKCNGVLDTFCHHAAVCAAGGERTLRHNAARDVLCYWAERAGLQPEKEKAGLLLPQRPEYVAFARRRPADVFVPSLSGSPTALDLAITAPQRAESLSEAGTQGGAAARAYAAVKASHLNTAQECSRQGVRFQPMVAESTGAWDATAGRVLWTVARAAAARETLDACVLHGELLQDLCCAIRRHRARAALSRRTAAAPAEPGVAALPAAAALLSAGPDG